MFFLAMVQRKATQVARSQTSQRPAVGRFRRAVAMLGAFSFLAGLALTVSVASDLRVADPAEAASTQVIAANSVSLGSLSEPQVRLMTAGFANTNVTTVSAGSSHACAIEGGVVFCWGRTGYGNLGDGTVGGGQDGLPTPVPVASVNGFTNQNVTAVAAGNEFTCALQGGSVWCWGIHTDGQLGNGSLTGSEGSVANTFERYPQRVSTSAVTGFANTGVTAISAGNSHACAIESGVVYCWGSSGSGQLGDGSQVSRERPVKVSASGAFTNNGTVSAVFAGGNHTCALQVGTLYCWGGNGKGQLGLDTTQLTTTATPVVAGDTGDNSGLVSASSGGNFSCAIKGTTLYCWGSNDNGRLGTDGGGDHHVPRQVSTSASTGFNPTQVSTVEAGVFSTCAIESGVVYCWGNQPGNGVSASSSRPTLVSTSARTGFGNTAVSAISVGRDARCAVEAGSVYCWGDNYYRSVGVDNTLILTEGAGNRPVKVGLAAAPGQPTGVTLTPGDSQLSVAFTVPITGTGITDYEYRVSTDSGATWTAWLSAGVNSSPFVITGLTNGSFHYVEIRAVNSGGPGTASDTEFGTPNPPAISNPGGTQSGGAASGGSSVVLDPSPTTVAPPVGVGESALVTVERQEQLTAPAGQSKILVGGELVDVTLTQASSGVRAVAPADRTPAQVEELQVLATSMISQLQTVLGADAVLSVSVRTTATGAVIVGLVRDPVTDELLEVPVEDVVLVSGGGLVLMASGADSQQPAQIGVDGVLEIPQSGQVSVYGSGLTPGADGEVVVMSTPRLISDFSVGATGEVSEQAALPADLELGDHTVVVTAGDEAASLGFRLVAASTQTGRDAEGVATGGTLPATGSDSQQLAWAILLLAMGGLVFMTARRPRRVL